MARAFAVVCLLLSACGGGDGEIPEFPASQPCIDYEAMMVTVDDAYTVPSLVPAPAGVRIVVDVNFEPFMGSSYPVPGGRMVWNVWILRWFDGDHLGAIGRAVGDGCRWYTPVI